MGQFDGSSKWLIQFHGDALLRLAGIKDIVSWKAVHSELVQTGQLPDGLIEARVGDRSEPSLFLVEVGTYAEQRVVDQLFRGTLLVALSRRVVPNVIALLLRPKGRVRVPAGVSMASDLDLTELGVRWLVVELWRASAEDLLRTEDPGAMPWVPLCRQKGPAQETLRRCREIIERKGRPEEITNLLAITQVFMRLR